MPDLNLRTYWKRYAYGQAGGLLGHSAEYALDIARALKRIDSGEFSVEYRPSECPDISWMSPAQIEALNHNELGFVDITVYRRCSNCGGKELIGTLGEFCLSIWNDYATHDLEQCAADIIIDYENTQR